MQLQTAGRKSVAAVEVIIDLIATLARKLKNGAVKLFEDFKGFVDDVFKWLEELFGGKKISQSDLLESWDSVAGRGRRLGQKLFKNDLIEIENFLKTLNCELELFPAKGSFEIEGFFVGNQEKAIFHEKAQAVFITDGKKMKLILREKATTYEFFHEYMHLKQAKSIGLQKYYKLGSKNTAGEIVKEEHVFNKIIENKDLFTRNELEHALEYLNDFTYDKNGIDPINFDFDINVVSLRKKFNNLNNKVLYVFCFEK
jgi:Metallopeptidase toxin 4